jgi:2,3,4,5-tetrahydropyridine-2,6-dicarboxylate N-succinyltransferase
VPARSVVVPGVRPRTFPAGDYGLPCGLIIGRRGERTEAKLQLNETLRDFGLEAYGEGS